MILDQSTILVDEADRATFNAHRWYLDSVGYPSTTIIESGRKRNVRLHRMLNPDVSPKFDIDHRDGNKLDNRRGNLRIVEHYVNLHNTGRRKNSRGEPGVLQRGGRFGVTVTLKNKSHWLGTFGNLSDAILAREDFKRAHIPDYDGGTNR